MIPIKLRLSGFLSYREEVTLDFTTFDLACIAGANGAGKSSLLDAITYALFGKARKTDETLINLQSDSAFVELVFLYETNRYRIQRTNPRGKTTILEFQISSPVNSEDGYGNESWKTLTERTVRDTQRRIEETLRMDYDTFINAAFFLQGKADQFTQQTPSRRKAILGSILGLDVWETYRLRAAERRRRVEGEVRGVDGRLAEINSELAQEGERVRRLNELLEDLERLTTARTAQAAVLESARKVQAQIEEQARLVEGLAKQVETTRRRAGQLALRHSQRLEEQKRYLSVHERESEIRARYAALQEARSRLAEWDRASQEHTLARQGPLLEIEKARGALENEVRELQAKDKEAHEHAAQLEALEERMEALQKDLAEVHQELEGRLALDAEIETARERLAAARAENPRLRSEMEDLKQRIDQLEAAPADAAVCPVCGQPLSLEQRRELIAELTEQGTLKGDQFRANRDLLKEADDLVGSLEKQRAGFKELEVKERRLAGENVQMESRMAGVRAVVDAWRETGKGRLKEIQRRLAEEDFAAEARGELAAVDAALVETGYDPAEHDRIRAEVAEASAVEEEMRALERAAAALEPLNREIEDLESETAAAEKELKVQEKAHVDAAASLAVLQADAPDVVRTQRELLNLQEEENALRMKVGSAQQNVEVLDSLRERKASLEAEREALSGNIARLKQLERAFGKDGVPALLIEQAIPQLENRANELLERLSGGEMSVRFQTQRELKTRDDLRETLDISISDRAGIRDYEMYSGGEAFRVNFAIRLALSDVLAHRAGARLQTLVIDEGFGSQDEVGRQRLVEAINTVREDFEKILVITHIETLKEAFPARIEVTKTDAGSSIEVMG